VLAIATADRDQYTRELEAAERAYSQEKASANLACDLRVAEARRRLRKAREHAWLRYSSKISGAEERRADEGNQDR
jgi:hypothetical protein